MTFATLAQGLIALPITSVLILLMHINVIFLHYSLYRGPDILLKVDISRWTYKFEIALQIFIFVWNLLYCTTNWYDGVLDDSIHGTTEWFLILF